MEEKNTTKNEERTKAIVEITGDKCKGCVICVVVCPQGCLELDQSVYNAKGFHPARFTCQGRKGACTACGICYMVYPDYAITAIKKLKKDFGFLSNHPEGRKEPSKEEYHG